MYVPLIGRIIQRHRILSTEYDTLLSDINSAKNRCSEAFLWSGKQVEQKDNSTAVNTVTKKITVGAAVLQQVCL